MKRILTLLSMIVTLSFSSQAAYYLVGEAPFGYGWDPSNGVELTENLDGTYSTTAIINGIIYFVLADNLAAPDDWVTFNDNYRMGPIGGNQEVAADVWITTQKAVGEYGAYSFYGFDAEYTLIFDPANSRFMIDSTTIPPYDFYTVAGTPQSVFGTEWDPTNTDNDMIRQNDGTYMLTKYGCYLVGSELEFKIVNVHDWYSSWPEDNYVLIVEESGTYDVTFTFNPTTHEVGASAVKTGGNNIRGDVNGDGEVNISDVSELIDIILNSSF